MSIINCTSDSFYSGSRTPGPEDAVERALRAEAEGAGIVDFGAESTRPDFIPVTEAEEIRRLVPAIRSFRRQSSLPVSVDTRKAAVARAALDEGADIINDVSSLADPAMTPLLAERKAAVVLMHGMSGGENAAVSGAVEEAGADDYVEGIRRFLLARADNAIAGGIGKNHIILDPGFGFNKSTSDNLVLLGWLARLRSADYPLLVGLSRKRFIGDVTGRAAEARLAGTIAANTLAVLGGADIIRVHDTAAAVDMLRVVTEVQRNT